MSKEMIIVAILLVSAFFVVFVFIWFLRDQISHVERSVNMRACHLQNMNESQYSRHMQLKTELRALERYLNVQYIFPQRRHGKMVKIKGEQE